MENLSEARAARLLDHLQNKDVAFLSASRASTVKTPEAIEKQAAINNKHTKELSRKLQSMGYGFIKVKGGYIEYRGTPNETVVEEDSFAVINNNIDPNEYHPDFLYNMLCLTKEFDQECILVKLSGKKPCVYDGDGNIIDTFNTLSINAISDYYTRLRKNKFVFLEENCDMENYRRADRAFYTTVLGIIDENKFKDKYPNLQKFRINK